MPPASTPARASSSTWASPQAQKVSAAQHTLTKARRDLRIMQKRMGVKSSRPAVGISDVDLPKRQPRKVDPHSSRQLRGLIFPPPGDAKDIKWKQDEKPKQAEQGPKPKRFSLAYGAVCNATHQLLSSLKSFAAKLGSKGKRWLKMLPKTPKIF